MKELTIIMPVLWFDETTGGWTHFKEMASRLALSGIKLLVFSPRAVGGKRKETLGNITIYRYSSIYLPQIPLLIFNPVDFIKMLSRVSSEVSSIDLIYDTTSGLLPVSPIIKLFFKLRCLKLPLVISILGELKEMESKGFLSLLFEFYLNIVARFSFSLSDKILLAGEKIIPRALRLGAHPKKMEIVRVGLKYEKNLAAQHILDEAEKAKLKATIGINQNDFVIGFVGRLSVGKGLDVLLNSVASVKVIIPQIKVLIVGDGGERNHLSILASELGIADIIIFLGHREDVPDLLQLMNIFVNLSKSEAGISGSQLEAMQTGLPSIITPFSNFLVNLKDAIIVPFDEVKEVTNAILFLFKNTDVRKAIGKNAAFKSKQLMDSYTWSGYVKKVTKIFEALICSKS